MLPVPEHLRKRYSIDPSAGAVRMLDRWVLAYNGPHKAQTLSTYFALQMARAIPSWGDSKKFRNPNLTHDKLAAMAGVKRSTFSSRMRHLRALTGSNDPRRSPVYLRGPRKGQPRQQFVNVFPVIHAKPGFMEANTYNLAIPDGRSDRMREHVQPGQYCPPNPAELLRSAEFGGYFTPEARLQDPCRGKRKQIFTHADAGPIGFAGANGAKAVPEWVWSDQIPMEDLSWCSRLVFTVYVMRGLLDPENKGHLRDFRQTDVAAATGLSVTQVHLCNEELKVMGICRVFSEQICRTPSKAMRRTPQQVLYLPVRQFTEAESAQELQRYRAALARARQGRWGEPDVARLSALHGALINEWKGKEHSLSAFWNELRRRGKHWACNKDLMNAVIPGVFNKDHP